jgi:hypothetical protein
METPAFERPEACLRPLRNSFTPWLQLSGSGQLRATRRGNDGIRGLGGNELFATYSAAEGRRRSTPSSGTSVQKAIEAGSLRRRTMIFAHPRAIHLSGTLTAEGSGEISNT